jgi:hypothetical protein
MERSKITGKTASMAEIYRQSSPRPNKLTTKMPRTTMSWKENPRRPRIEGIEISAEKKIRNKLNYNPKIYAIKLEAYRRR